MPMKSVREILSEPSKSATYFTLLIRYERIAASYNFWNLKWEKYYF